MSRTARRSRSRTRARRSSLRNLAVVLLLFTGLAVLALLILPPRGDMGASARMESYRTAGLLAFLVPAFLLVSSVRVISPSSLRGSGTFLLGLASNLYFLAALTDMVGRRFDPGLASRPGGLLAGRLVDYLTAVAGPVIAYLVLFTCFLGTLVIFTGWDLASDLLSIGRATKSRVRLPVRPLSGKGPGDEDGGGLHKPSFVGVGNVWAHPGPGRGEPPVITGFEDADRTAPEPRPPIVEIEPPPREERKAPPEPPPGQAKQPDRPPADAAPERHAASVPRMNLPPVSLLDGPSKSGPRGIPRQELEEKAALLRAKLADFGVECEITDKIYGPVLTRFEVKPGPGVKVNSILSLADDLALALKAKRIRILAPIPGRDAVGIEVPNQNPEPVYLREVLQAVGPQVLPMALGKDIEGKPFVRDLIDMPHLLIAGTTGSGKSVCMHNIICTLLMKRNPLEVKLALIDPKRLELSCYKEIPHLWAPMVEDVRKAKFLLEKLIVEMEGRYDKLQKDGVRSISEYNLKRADRPEERMAFIVLVIDELADLMQIAAAEVEPPIARLAAMARAVGIHLVVATQRPSVDVITGVIKANFASRIAFFVQSKTDSRTILDMNGAEKLLGKGDMLFVPNAAPEPYRVHGSYVSTQETVSIAEYWKGQDTGVDCVVQLPEVEDGNTAGLEDVEGDELLDQAREAVLRTRQASVSFLQRRLGVGYPRAGKLLDLLALEGTVGPYKGSKSRDILVPPEAPPGQNGDEH